MGFMTALPVPDQAFETDERLAVDGPWVTIVWNDPVNLMSYVVFVLRQYFKYPQEKAEALMLQVHNEGKAVVSSGGRDEMERDVTAMHSFGLWATLRNDGAGG